MENIQKDIEQNSYHKVYLLCGTEAYLRKQNRDNLVNALLPEGDTMNITRYAGKGIDIPEVLSMAQTLPFFAEKRVLVLEDTGFFKNAAEGLTEGIEELPDSTCMIFLENEVDKRSKTYKAVKKYGYVAELNTPDTKQLTIWLMSLAKKEGKALDAKTASYILEQCGTDMMMLKNELAKLFSYCLERDVITMTDVDDICANQITGKVFEMMDAITMQQQERAISLYRDLLSLREPALRILALLTRQIRILTTIKGLQADGVEFGQLASKAGVPPFTVKNYTRQCKQYTYSKLLSMYEACQETESQIKSGRITDVIGVELLIVGFSKE